jgi:hypothetical protein
VAERQEPDLLHTRILADHAWGTYLYPRPV